ncbi:MAG: ybaK/ebsC protein [Marmoricola sp.]|jgi:Cys-tRNA(Pro)/Cys-tRNA(Cys) deacylase|nr:ybaK/ebsC protein [Marmoricola sp.]
MVPELMARRSAGGTPATAALARAGVPFSLHPYQHDPAAPSYGLEAAEQLGLDPAAVFKTLLAEVDGRLVVGIVPVSGQLDLKALASALGGKKAAMADPAAAERTTGYVVGGISPIGQRKRLETVVDVSALDRTTVHVSGGRRGLELGLAPQDLVDLLGATVAPIGRA